jgi:hypothetical protein
VFLPGMSGGPLLLGAGGSPTFDAANMTTGQGAALTDGGTSAYVSIDNNWDNFRGLVSNSSGRRYFEVRVGSTDFGQWNTNGIGVVDASFNVNVGVLGTVHTYALDGGWYWTDPDGNLVYIYSGTIAVGDIMQVLVDWPTTGIQFGYKGIWANTGTGVPDIANPQFFFSGGSLWPAVTADKAAGHTGSKYTLNTRGPFTYAPPSGASAWG